MSKCQINEPLLSAERNIRDFADRASDPYDVLVYAVGIAASRDLHVTHDILASIGSHVMIEPSDDSDGTLYVDITDGKAVIQMIAE